MPSHYLNQCWNIVNWTLRNKLKWNFNRNFCFFIQWNAFKNVVCEMTAILSRGGMSLPFKWWSHMFLSQCVQDKHQVPEILDPRLGMKQLFSDITKDQWLHNYANPVYGVATICHQVRWLRWGHPKLFHTATSLLIWYKMFCVRDISYRLIWMEFINMFSVYAKSGTHSRFNW